MYINSFSKPYTVIHLHPFNTQAPPPLRGRGGDASPQDKLLQATVRLTAPPLTALMPLPSTHPRKYFLHLVR